MSAGFSSKQLQSSRIIDVGAGASVLADSLLASGVSALTLLDLADAALAKTKQRLGLQAAQINWLSNDILQLSLPKTSYDIWHDRAGFHFLTSQAQRDAYISQLQQSSALGG